MKRKTKDNRAFKILAVIFLLLWIRAEYSLHRYKAEQEALSQRTGIITTPWLGVDFRQDGELAYMESIDPYTTRVELRSAPFEFRLPRMDREQGISVAAWKDDSIFNFIGGDVRVSDIPYFQPGTGIADTEYGSGTLYLNNEAHNSFFYNRLHPADPGKVAVAITTLWNKKDIKIEERSKPVYIVMYVDLDRDQVMDNGEYEKVILEFTR